MNIETATTKNVKISCTPFTGKILFVIQEEAYNSIFMTAVRSIGPLTLSDISIFGDVIFFITLIMTNSEVTKSNFGRLICVSAEKW